VSPDDDEYRIGAEFGKYNSSTEKGEYIINVGYVLKSIQDRKKFSEKEFLHHFRYTYTAKWMHLLLFSSFSTKHASICTRKKYTCTYHARTHTKELDRRLCQTVYNIPATIEQFQSSEKRSIHRAMFGSRRNRSRAERWVEGSAAIWRVLEKHKQGRALGRGPLLVTH